MTNKDIINDYQTESKTREELMFKKLFSEVNGDGLEWEDPIPFDLYNLPLFNIDVFSPSIREMVLEVTRFNQTPVDLSAMCSIGALSTVLTNKIVVKPIEGWIEPVNTFTTTLMESSNRKSGVYEAITAPIYQYEDEQIDKLKTEVNKRKAQRKSLEKRIEKLQADFAKTEDPAIAMHINETIEKLDTFPELFLPAWILDDVTPEIIVSRLKENDEKISIMSDEGDLFENMKENGRNQEKLDVLLKGYSGGRLRVDRISRATERIEQPLITICISAQPSVIQNMPSKINNRGIIPRFLFSIPNDFMGYRTIQTKAISSKVKGNYQAFIHKLLNLSTSKPLELTFDEDAQKLSYQFQNSIEREFKEHGVFSDQLKAWGGKLVGQLMRITGLIHVSRQAEIVHDIHDISTTIQLDTLKEVLSLKDYFIAHAQKAYGVMKLDQSLADAEFLLKKLKNQQTNKLSKQKIWQMTRSKFKKAQHLNQALKILETRHYIQYTFEGKSGNKAFINMNPVLLNNSIPNEPETELNRIQQHEAESHDDNLEVPKHPKTKVELDDFQKQDYKALSAL